MLDHYGATTGTRSFLAETQPMVIGGQPVDSDERIDVTEPATGAWPTDPVGIFDSDEAALRMANHNIYGLAASIWTRDIGRAMRYSTQLDAGTVWVNDHDIVDSNMPCGGFKQSGFGKDKGPEQLHYDTRTKANWITV